MKAIDIISQAVAAAPANMGDFKFMDLLETLIDKEIKAAERRGFECAVVGGHDLGSQMVKGNNHPLVIYCADKKTANELGDLVKTAGDLVEVATPVVGRG